MSNLDNRIEELLLHYNPDEIAKSIKAVQKKKQEEKDKQAEAALKIVRDKAIDALIAYTVALGLSEEMSDKEQIELKKALEIGLKDFEKGLKKDIKYNFIDEDKIIGEFFKNLHKTGWV